MSLDTAQAAAEKRHAESVGVPATLVIDGTNYKGRIYLERGQRMLMEGGSIQTRKLSAVVLCSVLPAAKIIDENGNTRSITLTHRETGIEYRINTGGVNQSPQRIFWTLRCSQPTAMP